MVEASAPALLQVRGLKTWFPIRRGVFGQTVGHVRAVDDVDLDVHAGETLGLVGESGCGKTTLGRSILRLVEPTAGTIHFAGKELRTLSHREIRPLRRDLQMIFQDPYGSLNPRLTVGQMISEPMVVHGLCSRAEADAKVIDLLRKVGLEAEHRDHYPHQFSGGQRQRVGIARALALQPKLIVCDEAVSALDVSVQAQVVNLLQDLQDEFGIAYIFIAHDLSVVGHLCHRVAVMYLGEILETGSVDQVYTNPMHPYTQALMSAVPPDHPGAKKQRIMLEGDPPSPTEPSSAARFILRFPHHRAAFEPGDISLQQVEPGHWVRCANLDALRDLASQGANAWQGAC